MTDEQEEEIKMIEEADGELVKNVLNEMIRSTDDAQQREQAVAAKQARLLQHQQDQISHLENVSLGQTNAIAELLSLKEETESAWYAQTGEVSDRDRILQLRTARIEELERELVQQRRRSQGYGRRQIGPRSSPKRDCRPQSPTGHSRGVQFSPSERCQEADGRD
jgi:hypothetical protein